MREWRIEYTDKVLAELEVLDRPVRRQIIDRLEWFAEHFHELTPAPLHGDWKGFFKFRIGDRRVVYNFESSKQLIRVHQIDRRDKIYKRHS